MKTKNKKKHRQPKENRPSMKAGWLSLLGLISALFIGAWVWMRRQSAPTVDAAAQLDTGTKTESANTITYTGAPYIPPVGVGGFNHSEFSANDFA